MCKTYRKVSRGQVWFLVDPKADDYDGSIQGKNRPVVVVSNNTCNENSPIIHIVPLTTATKNHLPTHVHFNDGKFDQTALCEQLRPVKESLFYDKSYYKYTLSDDVMQKVDEAIAIQLGLSLVMPNAERFWKSVEQVIRFKVKEAIQTTKVSAIDISKVSCLLTKAVDDELKQEKPKSEGFVMISNDKIENMSFETKSQFISHIAEPEKIKRKPNVWTNETKKDFVDTYYKYGPQAAADKYGVKLGSAYRLKWNFEKELKNGTT